MIQSKIPYRDMIHSGGWGFTPDRHDTPKRQIPTFPLDSQCSVFEKKEMLTDPWQWNPATPELYEGMLVYVIDENQIYCLVDIEKWNYESGWSKYEYDKAEQEEFVRLKKLDNLLS